jgi:hypothetical protein
MGARLVGLAMLLVVVCSFVGANVSPAVADDGDGSFYWGYRSQVRWAPIHMNIAPALYVSNPFPGYWWGTKALDIWTNTNTAVLLVASPFVRTERDTDGNPLSTYDAIGAYAWPYSFQDFNPTGGGSPLQVNHWSWFDDGWYRGYWFTVGSHNGGFRMDFGAWPLNWSDPYNLKNDAGCYTSWVYAGFFTLPVGYWSDAELWFYP